MRCHAVQGAHEVVEMSDENIKEKAIRSSFAPVRVAIATEQDIDAHLRQRCDSVLEKEFR